MKNKEMRVNLVTKEGKIIGSIDVEVSRQNIGKGYKKIYVYAQIAELPINTEIENHPNFRKYKRNNI
ncbi:MAG: hypothetical protein WC055_00080 [Melioribacteraceae bacterium]